MKSRVFIIGYFALLILLALALRPIPQDPAYHNFAAQKTLLGIPNFWNVISNLAFIVVAIAAWRERADLPGAVTEVFRVGVFLTALGSAYYHWSPTTETLFWDRLPMTIAFSAVTAAMITKRVDPAWGPRMLWPLVLASAATVVYWRWTEHLGRGNLVPYGIVQFGTVLLVFAVLLIFPRPGAEQSSVWLALAMYVIAKLLEHFDAQIASVLRVMGGHPLKHVAAALGCWFLWRGAFSANPARGSGPNTARSQDSH